MVNTYTHAHKHTYTYNQSGSRQISHLAKAAPANPQEYNIHIRTTQTIGSRQMSSDQSGSRQISHVTEAAPANPHASPTTPCPAPSSRMCRSCTMYMLVYLSIFSSIVQMWFYVSPCSSAYIYMYRHFYICVYIFYIYIYIYIYICIYFQVFCSSMCRSCSTYMFISILACIFASILLEFVLILYYIHAHICVYMDMLIYVSTWTHMSIPFLSPSSLRVCVIP